MTNGTIRGRINFLKAPAGEDVVVGLYSSAGETYAPSGRGFRDKLVDSQRLGKGGAFQFSRLSGGGYFIALLVPPAILRVDGTNNSRMEKAVKVSGHPGILALSRNRPRIDTGLITIRVD